MAQLFVMRDRSGTRQKQRKHKWTLGDNTTRVAEQEQELCHILSPVFSWICVLYAVRVCVGRRGRCGGWTSNMDDLADTAFCVQSVRVPAPLFSRYSSPALVMSRPVLLDVLNQLESVQQKRFVRKIQNPPQTEMHQSSFVNFDISASLNDGDEHRYYLFWI